MNFPLLLERSRDWTKDRLDEGKKVCAWVWVCDRKRACQIVRVGFDIKSLHR